MSYDVIIDPRSLVAACDTIDAQLPFATAKTLNELATSFQAAERRNIESSMTIRRPWVLQGIKIDRGDFATKDSLVARIHVDSQRSFLDKFETGGTRTPLTSLGLAVPYAARPSQTALIPNNLRPNALGLRQVGGAALVKHASGLRNKGFKSFSGGVLRGAFRVYEGGNRTILIQAPNGAGVILQRVSASKGRELHIYRGAFHASGVTVGRRDAGLKVLYVLRPRTPVPASLHFAVTAAATAAQWPAIFSKFYADAVRTAR